MADNIRVNGNLYGWGSIILKVDGVRLYGWTEVSYGDKRERQYGWGMGRHQAPMGRSPGKYTPEPCKLKGFVHAVAALRDRLAFLSEDDSYGDTIFDVQVQYDEPGLGVQTALIAECVVTSDLDSATEGPENTLAELECMPMYVQRNGKTLYTRRDGSPG